MGQIVYVANITNVFERPNGSLDWLNYGRQLLVLLLHMK